MITNIYSMSFIDQAFGPKDMSRINSKIKKIVSCFLAKFEVGICDSLELFCG